MGLSSSQARLLNLTNRMHQIEYKAAKLEAEKLQLANDSSRAYEDYLEALDRTIIEKKTIANDGSLQYEKISCYQDLVDMGLYLKHVDNSAYYNSFNELKADFDLGKEIVNLKNDNGRTITNIILSGLVVIVDTNHMVDGKPYETSVATNTALREVSDETELKKEEAKYEANMKKIDMKDRKYDTELAALETERNAVSQEMDTLKTVAKENVDRTFKLFS